ncbi:MAG: hypothetical protein RMK29_16100 [Myxococcales bacterium]|nr:hypothetical protein [Myxococcota bacterium]MDW8283239.1 hypothetical protein [Myxococcales bacterium]
MPYDPGVFERGSDTLVVLHKADDIECAARLAAKLRAHVVLSQ